MPLEQTTDKLRDKVPQIDGDKAKETIFGIFDSLKPMFAVAWGFMITMSKKSLDIFINAWSGKNK